jgi:hypothetical protein
MDLRFIVVLQILLGFQQLGPAVKLSETGSEEFDDGVAFPFP